MQPANSEQKDGKVSAKYAALLCEVLIDNCEIDSDKVSLEQFKKLYNDCYDNLREHSKHYVPRGLNALYLS